MHEIISKYKLGDMEVIYQKGRNRKGYDAVGMLLIPAGSAICPEKECDVEPLIQAKLVGDDYPFNYSQGRTMRFAETVTRMEYAGQRKEEGGRGNPDYYDTEGSQRYWLGAHCGIQQGRPGYPDLLSGAESGRRAGNTGNVQQLYPGRAYSF